MLAGFRSVAGELVRHVAGFFERRFNRSGKAAPVDGAQKMADYHRAEMERHARLLKSWEGIAKRRKKRGDTSRRAKLAKPDVAKRIRAKATKPKRQRRPKPPPPQPDQP